MLAASAASAADVPFYVISIAGKGNANLFSEARNAPKGDLPYVLVEGTKTACCFRAGPRPGTRKAAAKADDDAAEMMSDEDKPIFRHAGHVAAPAAPEPDIAYGFEGMQAVTKAGRDARQVTLRAGDPVFVRTCYSGEGLRLRLFHRPADKKPYASYYYYLGYDVEPTCR